MSNELTSEDDPDINTQLILLAASKHDQQALKPLLRLGSASVQDPETGFTPLHAAIAACEDLSSEYQAGDRSIANGSRANGERDGEGVESEIAAAVKTVKLLLQNGAIWNDLDGNDETPGCLALRLGLKELYDVMVDAGVRAEMLLNRLDEYEPLDDDDQDEDDDQEEHKEENTDIHDGPCEDLTVSDNPDATAGGCNNANPSGDVVKGGLRNEDYLQASLRFQDGRILDDAGNGVMMAWETDIMKLSADVLCPSPGLRVLNIGHGMGIIDQFLQDKSPSAHHIIEAHPAVLERMRKDGWYAIPSVIIHEGRWQDVVPKIMEDGISFDGIYFDTFAEDYSAFRSFFSDYLIALLEDGGKWGFFNGMGADRQISYDVYAKVVEMDLFESGFDVGWRDIAIAEMGTNEWEGAKRRYWYV